MESCNVCNFPISVAGVDGNLDSIVNRINSKSGAWVVTLNTEMVSRIARMPEYGQLLANADMFVADGMPIVWASQFSRNSQQRVKIEERTTGVDLVDRFLRLDVIPNFAIIGGRNPKATLELYPRSLDACKYMFTGMVDGSPDQMEMFAEQIKQNDIKVVFVALGVPKQDKIALQLRRMVPSVVLLGIGGTFEILGPEGSRAPEWMQKSGLEWFYRFTREPSRLWKRYFIEYPSGVSHLIKDYFKR